MRHTLFACILFATHIIGAQTLHRHQLPEHKMTYVAIAPPATPKGAIVLLTGFNQSADDLLAETRLEELTYLHGFLLIVVPIGQKLYLDRAQLRGLNAVLQHASTQYHFPKGKTAIGGFSAGGTIALRYTQYCQQFPNDYPITPKAVFAVDSPTDLTELYRQCVRTQHRQFSPTATTEANYVVHTLENELGKPEDPRNRYALYSPFLLNDTSNEGLVWLKNIPVRCYHDADLQWYLQHRKTGLAGMNVTAASELVSRLLLLGNTQAEVILANGRGMRAGGERHPHSMSIVDEQDFISWVKKNLELMNN